MSASLASECNEAKEYASLNLHVGRMYEAKIQTLRFMLPEVVQ